MKIRDLNLDDYVIVYDIGKSENSAGMTVVGRVHELVFKDESENRAMILSMGTLYIIYDNNYFDLWSNYIENKTEHIAFDKDNTKKAKKLLSNDLQQRKRKDENTKPDYYQFDDFEMYEIVEAICKHYNPVVAAWIGQAIQYIGRAPRKNGKEDIGKARDMIERAYEVWDVK